MHFSTAFKLTSIFFIMVSDAGEFLFYRQNITRFSFRLSGKQREGTSSVLKLLLFAIVLSLMFKANKSYLFLLVGLSIFLKAKEQLAHWGGVAWEVIKRQGPCGCKRGNGPWSNQHPASQIWYRITRASDEIDSESIQSKFKRGVASVDEAVILCRK